MSATNFDEVQVGGVPLLPTPGNVITGKAFFANSVTGSNSGNDGSKDSPYASIDYAVGLCVAGRGDFIYAMPGHDEVVSAAAGLALDVAGITIVFLGSGANKAKITFGTVVGADMNVDAASITLVNPKFVAALDALTGPIDVNAADFTIINAEYHDGTSIDTTDALVADATGSTRLKIYGWKYYKGNEAGTQKQSNIQFAAGTAVDLRDIDIRGNFDTGNVENGAAATNINMNGIRLVNTNADPSPAMTLHANTTGIADDVQLRVASGTTYVSSVAKMSWSDSCLGFSTDGYAGEGIGTALASGVEGKLDTIDAVLGALDDAAAAGAVTNLDTGMAYLKQLVTELAVVDGFFDVPTADAAPDVTMRDVIGRKTDAAVTTVATNKSIMAYIKGLLGQSFAMPRCVEKSDGAVLAGTDDLFTISGGPVRAKIVGLVTTIIGGAANMSLQHTTIAPVATVELNAAPVAIDTDAVGTIYTNIGAGGAFTPSTGLGFKIGDPVTVEEVEYILAPGTVKALGSGAQSGVIKWYMFYVPLSPSSLVVAAA